uniref:Uncharacterized protein TCIL3000_3_760 n=1 Tax=Trypanosoma congolense (strain IL3000) TaxID=1068625 RepID=G0UJV0_TRYCI|nr:unnamed protein product [Trypanosoma congolense IL3000]
MWKSNVIFKIHSFNEASCTTGTKREGRTFARSLSHPTHTSLTTFVHSTSIYENVRTIHNEKECYATLYLLIYFVSLQLSPQNESECTQHKKGNNAVSGERSVVFGSAYLIFPSAPPTYFGKAYRQTKTGTTKHQNFSFFPFPFLVLFF